MIDVLKKIKKLWNYGEARTAIASICAHSVSISIGICQGYSAIVIPQLMASSEIPLNLDQASWVASLGAVTNPLGSILSGVLSECLGRKRSMQISSLPFIVGWLTLALAKDITWLYAGRLITGIAAGMSTACYTYVTEVSTPSHRGILQSLGPICGSLGILLTYSFGYILPWHIIAYGAILFSLFTLVSIQLVPESPGWLITKERNNESLESLVWFRRNINNAQMEYDDLVVTQKSPNGGTNFKAYLSQSTIKPFFILIIFFFCQELCGIYTILYYAVSFFKDSNVDVDEYVASMVVGFIRFVMSIFAAFLVSKYARKHLCLISSIGMAVTMTATASYIKYYEIHNLESRIFTIFPLICVLFNVIFSMVGMMPIPWIMVGELFPLEVRGIMCGLVICIAQFMVFVCVKIHPYIVAHLNFSGALYIFAVTSACTIFFAWFVLPETKDKSLLDIQSYFSEKSSKITGTDNFAFVMELEGNNLTIPKEKTSGVAAST